MNLHEYFSKKFPDYSDMLDTDFTDCPLDSVVGKSCKKVIDKAVELIGLLNCVGESCKQEDILSILSAVVHHCECDFYG